jgi:predicted phage tail protein
MSDLIDRIFDVEKISAEVKAITEQITALTDTINTIKSNLSTIGGDIRKSKGMDDLVAQSQNLNSEFSKGQKAVKDWQTQVATLQAKTEQLTGAEKAANIEIAKARLELQAAQKSIKDAAVEQIVLSSKTDSLQKNYYALKQELALTERQFKSLTQQEQNSAKGKELMDKYNELAAAVNKTDEAFGHYQNRVGQYEEAVKPLRAELRAIAQEMATLATNGDRDSEQYKALSERGAELTKSLREVHTELKNAGAENKGIEEIAGAFKAVGAAAEVAEGSAALFGIENDNVTESIQKLVAIQSVMNGVEEVAKSLRKESIFMMGVQAAKSAVLAAWKTTLIALESVFGVTAATAMALATAGISTVITGVILLIANFNSVINSVRSFLGITKNFEKTEQQIRALNSALKDFDELTALATERMKALGDADKDIITYKKQRFAEELKLNQERYKALSSLTRKLTDDEKQQLKDSADFIRNSNKTKYALDTEAINNQREQKQKAAEEQKQAAEKEAQEAEKHNKALLDARRKLEDSQIELMQDGLAKELKKIEVKYQREIEDQKATGKLKNIILQEQKNEEAEIKRKYAIKDLEESIKNDEVEIQHMKDTGVDSLEAEKALLKKKMELEIKQGGDEVAIRKKYQYLLEGLEAKDNDERVEKFKKALEQQTDTLKYEYSKQETELKKQYAKGLINQDQYNKELEKIKLKALIDVNNKQIEALQKELANGKMSDEKRAELSKELRDLQIQNENAVADAVIKDNDDKVKSDKENVKKRIAITEALLDASRQVFGGIADFAINKSQAVVDALEKQKDAQDAQFDAQESNLDKAIMSEEVRAQKKAEIEKKKAAAEKVINDKIQAEKVKQAKWEREKEISDAIVSAALAIIKAWDAEPPLDFIAGALASSMAAIQIATILSTPLPAYAEGTQNHPGGLSLWGEKQPEVAVLPSGKAFIADKPTITNFDAGTKIYKSVAEYENYINKETTNQFVFDYQKMAEAMPKDTIELNGNGSWTLINKTNNRRTVINRRYSLGN